MALSSKRAPAPGDCLDSIRGVGQLNNYIVVRYYQPCPCATDSRRRFVLVEGSRPGIVTIEDVQDTIKNMGIASTCPRHASVIRVTETDHLGHYDVAFGADPDAMWSWSWPDLPCLLSIFMVALALCITDANTSNLASAICASTCGRAIFTAMMFGIGVAAYIITQIWLLQ
jgi:hypothetical protein